MIKSMTAYANLAEDIECGELSIELRSVNHRFLDLVIRMPETLRPFEADVRKAISSRLARGRVECYIRMDALKESQLELNESVVSRLLNAATILKQSDPTIQQLRTIDVLKWEGVLQSPQVDSEKLEADLLNILSAALDQMIAARKREGDNIAPLIADRVKQAANHVNELKAYLPEIQAEFKRKLLAKCEELDAKVDSDRIEQEIVLLLQKADVSEEIDRLHVHLKEIENVLKAGEPAGRRLDFLAQELHREVNTLGSKSHDVKQSQIVVELKVLVEQIREQVQNIE